MRRLVNRSLGYGSVDDVNNILCTLPIASTTEQKGMQYKTICRAASCLLRDPESAHMLDLSVDELVAMAKMGSAMALAYACIVCTLEDMNAYQRSSAR